MIRDSDKAGCMERLIIWGTLNTIEKYIPTVEAFVSAGDIEVSGICFKDRAPHETDKEEKFSFISNEASEWKTAGCVLVCTESYSHEIIQEVLATGISREKLIPCKLIKTEGFSFSRYMRLIRSRITILSNCCWGGLTYHFFRMDFLSPTINLFITDEDYIRFLEDLDTMLKDDPVMERMAYNADEDLEYPVFDLNGIKLYMNHCHDPQIGLNEWKKRCARVNHENILATMITASESIAERFDALPFRKKVCFVPFETKLASCVQVDPGDVLLVSYVNSFASGARKLYDPWILLEEGRISYTAKCPDQTAYDAYLKEIEAVLKKSEIILIYGAQAMGTRAYNMLKTLPDNKLSGFAVTSMGGNQSEKYGYPVMSIMDWQKTITGRKIPPDRTAVFMALHPDYYDEVRQTLMENGFQHILTFEDLELLYHRFHNSASKD